MGRKKKNARHIKRKGKRIKMIARLCWIVDDGIRPGEIRAAAEYVAVRA